MTPASLATYVDAAAASLDLPIAPAYRSGVLRYFALAAEQASLLMAVRLTTADEPAEAFRPIGPEGR